MNQNAIVEIEKITPKTPMHPLTLFIKMAKTLGISEVSMNTKHDSLVYTLKIISTSVTEEFCEAANTLNAFTKEYRGLPCNISVSNISYICSRKGNECLSIITEHFDKLRCQDGKYTIPTVETMKESSYVYKTEIHIYDEGKAWNFTPKNKSSRSVVKGFPCSMKDFFYFQDKSNAEYKVFYALFLAWGDEYPIWKDLAADFKQGCCYSSIPLDLIFQCSSRRELLEKRYGISFSRSNKEDIGRGIFYARASRVVKENELHLLFNCNLKPCYIGRTKTDVTDSLTHFIYENMKKKYPDMTLKRRRGTIDISWNYINDAIRMSIKAKRMVPLQFRTLNSIYEWHNELQIIIRNGHLPTVKIPKDSRFKKLKMPDNCIRLKTRKMFVEESTFQHNCVATYIQDVNNDRCSIWSLREPDGNRYTIEVGIYGGRYKLYQMLGWDNEDAPPELVKKIKNHLSNQFPT